MPGARENFKRAGFLDNNPALTRKKPALSCGH